MEIEELRFPEPKPKWRPRRPLNDEEQAEQVEGVLGEWSTCQRCGMKVQPWKTSDGNTSYTHYLCPGDDRKLIVRPFIPGGRWGTVPGRRTSYVGTIGATRVLEVFEAKKGHTYAFRVSLDKTVTMSACGEYFKTRVEALNHAVAFLAKNVQWEHVATDMLTNDILSSLGRRNREEHKNHWEIPCR